MRGQSKAQEPEMEKNDVSPQLNCSMALPPVQTTAPNVRDHHIKGMCEDGPLTNAKFLHAGLPNGASAASTFMQNSVTLAPQQDPMELLSGSWSTAALEVANAVSLRRLSGEKSLTRPTQCSGSTPQMVMERIMGQSDACSAMVAKQRRSYSSFHRVNGGNYSAPTSPPLSPRPVTEEHAFCRSFSGVRNPLREMSMKRWLKDNKERKREVTRLHNAEVHAAMAVAGVAAAVASITAATASATIGCSQNYHCPHHRHHACHQDLQNNACGKINGGCKSCSSLACLTAVASAAALVARQCVEAAEHLGADHEQITTMISSAVNVKTPGDVMTLTAAAATALRGASALKARASKHESLLSHATVLPYVKAPFNMDVDDSVSEDSEADPGCNQLDFLSRGSEFLKRTRKGQLHWRALFVYLNKHSQVVVKSQGKYMGGTIIKCKKRIVVGVHENIPAWHTHISSKEEEEGEEEEEDDGGGGTEEGLLEAKKWYFGIQTEHGGVMELHCKSKEQHQLWTKGILRLLSHAGGNANH